MLKKYRKFHLIGIGGSGMSAIATILAERGYEVYGTDLQESAAVQRLRESGATICIGHVAENLAAVDAVVVSTAIPESNPELQEARKRGLPVLHRSDIVAALMAEGRGIAVAGAHGKTTTTSMLAMALEFGGVDPTVIIGGDLDYIGGNAKSGSGQFVVAEADESDGSFLKLSPQLAVITNVENDHLDHYGSLENILIAFRQFLQRVAEAGGTAIICYDDVHARALAEGAPCPVISYGLETPGVRYTIRDLHEAVAESRCEALCDGKVLGTLRLRVPGRHNIANALAVIAAGCEIGVPFEKIAAGLWEFTGAKRRFQTKDKVCGVWIVDDYGHHPTEIAATLRAARQTEPQRLICVFQPHRYSRTHFLRQEFGRCFQEADVLVLTDIYAAGEAPLPGISGTTLCDEVQAQTGQQFLYVQDVGDVPNVLERLVRPGDLVITMGAGNIYRAGEQLATQLRQREQTAGIACNSKGGEA